ncbi:MAG: phospholipid/cholesterol/gamma-HCH transport system substrate-binding protein [Frankiaceae bacterium]|jgi:phospholipid/cholesterol/gamma-HCH transport system substrate-binding protein|nr:phospholipid/cholesterol/gamma-HCH transport system substrate-binding protein [Frankiaceae bacterium]
MKRRIFAIVAVVALAVAGTVAASASSGRSGTMHLTARFTRVIGLYQGNDVRVLGVKIGQIDSLKVEGTYVVVKMSYDGKYKLPADVGAVLVPPSVVSDRYIQLTPAYQGGPTLPDNALLDVDRTVVPLEFDEIFKNLDQLNRALGPNGANAHGALSRLVDVSAANLDGNGAALNGALKEFSAAISTLAGSRGNLFDTVRQLQQFTTMLAQNDGGIRALNGNLAKVGSQLAGERKDLGAALANLSTALQLVSSFVGDNRTRLTSDISKLTSVTNILTKEKKAIAEVVDMAPYALSNLSLAYDPKAHTLDTLDAASQAFAHPTGPNGLFCQLSGNSPIPGLHQALCAKSAVTVRSFSDLLTVKP